ncbi:hypothetical protein CR513_07583, partial [Mucuna pruriens]
MSLCSTSNRAFMGLKRYPTSSRSSKCSLPRRIFITLSMLGLIVFILFSMRDKGEGTYNHAPKLKSGILLHTFF